MTESVKLVCRLGRLRREIVVVGESGVRSMLLYVPENMPQKGVEDFVRRRIEMVKRDLEDLTREE